MAKSQRRGNKEVKKPKKIKEPPAAPMSLSRGAAVVAVASKPKNK